MGRIAKVLSFVRDYRNNAHISDVKVNSGGEANINAEHFAPLGDDSHPLANDFLMISDVDGTGRASAVGYIDPKNQPRAKAGEKIIYARDINGNIVVELWLDNQSNATLKNGAGTVKLTKNGEISGTNQNGYHKLTEGGTFEVNGVTIAPDGAIETPTSVKSPSVIANGKELTDHNHLAGTPPGNTGVNN